MLTEQQLAILRSEPGANRLAKAMSLASLAGVTQMALAKDLGLSQLYVSEVVRQRYRTITAESARQLEGSDGANRRGPRGRRPSRRRCRGNPEAVRDAAYEAAARESHSSVPAPPALPSSPDVAYRAGEGEVLDQIAHLRYGTPAVVEELLEANPRLAPAPPRLPGGTLVDLPLAAAAPPALAVSLWD